MKNKVCVLNQYYHNKLFNLRMGDKAALMCPNCYSLYFIRQNGLITAKTTEDIDLLISPRYHIQCPVCDYADFTAVALETPIAFAVASLNKMGFPTEGSCCGHDDESVNNAYIKFEDEDVGFDTLPDNWELNGGFLRPVIPNLKESILNLNRWVRKMMDSSKTGDEV